jgi:hypothetical protein
MTRTTTAGGRSRNPILTAMIFAVLMTFIAQTIISIAVPQIRRELGPATTIADLELEQSRDRRVHRRGPGTAGHPIRR